MPLVYRSRARPGRIGAARDEIRASVRSNEKDHYERMMNP
jgi:hypothetical protein